MMSVPYAVPTDDILFALRSAAADASETKIGESLVRQILDEAGRLAINRLAPLNLAGDRHGAGMEQGRVVTAPGFAEAYRDWSSAGWMGVAVPEVWGGSALPPLLVAALDEVWNAANMAFYVCPTLTQAAQKLILAHGSDAQKEEYLPRLASGEWTASMGLTEPQAGSDLSLLTTKAERSADGSYRIRGGKIFTSFGDHEWSENIVGLVLARIAGAPTGSRGISLFIVPKFLAGGVRNDVVCAGLEHKLGLRASPTCTMSYGGHEGAVGYLLGKENAGLATMFVMMNKARIACALQGVGLAERALQQARLYAAERVQGKRREGPSAIAAHPDVRRMLLRMEALTLAARVLTYAAAAAVEQQPADAGTSGRGSFLTPLAKLFASEAAVEVANLNIQVHGGMGYIEETGASQLLRDARAIPIYEGANGIQAIDLVERKIIPDRGATLRQEMASARDHAAAARQLPDLGELGAGLDTALDLLERAVAWLIDEARSPDERLAAASPFASMVASTLAAGLLAKGLIEASATSEGPPSRTLRAARFYAAAILPIVAAHAQDVTSCASLLCDQPLDTFAADDALVDATSPRVSSSAK